MLQLRPICEHCATELPPDSSEARICSYECTFCAGCVEAVLDGVCPNCGGGFERRPVRPITEWRAGVSLGHYPPVNERRHKPVDQLDHAALITRQRTAG